MTAVAAAASTAPSVPHRCIDKAVLIAVTTITNTVFIVRIDTLNLSRPAMTFSALSAFLSPLSAIVFSLLPSADENAEPTADKYAITAIRATIINIYPLLSLSI